MRKDQEIEAKFETTFGGPAESCAFAPGRIEFIGNHTDYNGGLTMGVATHEGITVAVRKRPDRRIVFVSDQGGPVEASLDRLVPGAGPSSWTNYPLGVTSVMLGLGMDAEVGYEMLVTSSLPAGAGLSSSAAFELATAYALAGVYGFTTDKLGYVRIGRQAENEFVGMPCGILDQGVSAFGKADHLVRIDCASERFTLTAMPSQARFWILNSNKKHALVDSAYGDRNRECHQALAILQRRFPELRQLADAARPQLEAAKSELGDLLYRRAGHIVDEVERVRTVESVLQSEDLAAVGACLFESHESSRSQFENSTPELDFLVNQLREQPSVYGARLTGGGFGGAVMALTGPEFGEAQAAQVAQAYENAFGLAPSIFSTRAGDGARLL